MINDFINMAIKGMRTRKLRAFLTLVGITISIATIFVLVSVSLGLEKTIQDEFAKLGGDKFFVQPRGQFGPPGSATGAQLSLDDIKEIEKVFGVKEVTFFIATPSKLSFKERLRFINVYGIEPDKQDIAFGSYDLDEGRLFKESDTYKAILGSQYKYNDYAGQPIFPGDKIFLNDIEFKVIAIFEVTGSPPDDQIVYIPEKTLREVYDIPERVDYIIIQVQDGTDIEKVAEDTERKLMKFRDVNEKTKDFTILTPEELLATFGTVLNIVTFFLFGIAAISLLVGGINIANTMFTSVLERTKDIGVMKAIGAQNKDILTIFLIEAGILGLIGGSLGIIFGFAFSKILEYVAVNYFATTLLRTLSPLWLVFGSLAFAFLAGAVSGIYPAWKATKIKPVEALRYE